MPTNGKKKGARAELEVCRSLHTWWIQVEPSVGDEDLHFKRTPGSGGWAHGKGRAAFGTAADVVTNAKLFPFSVEVKHREGWAMSTFLAGKKSPVWSWWKQACTQGAETKKIPMLWFRKNHAEWIVLLPSDYFAGGLGHPLSAWVKGTLAPLSLPIHPVAFPASQIMGLPPSWFATSQLVTI